MELENLKLNWEAMSQRVAHLELINKKNIMDMTKQRYKNKFNNLLKYETLGTVVCVAALIFILFNFQKLDTSFYIICGVIVSLFLIILPILTLNNIKRMKQVKIDSENYKNTLFQFERSKQKLIKTQLLVIPFGAIVFFASMPVFSKIMGNGDFFERIDTPMVIFICLMFLGLMMFSAWGYKKYNQVANSAENILRELDE